MSNKLPHIKAKYNDKSDPSYVRENQCVAYKRTCPVCGERFNPQDLKCGYCGSDRPRCKNRAMDGEELCRCHISGRSYSLYNKLCGTLTDAALEEFIERDERGLEQEFALAKIALSCVLDEGKKPSSEQLMKMVKEFFVVAEKKKNIEKGQVLNISWNDDLVNSLRLRVRKLIRTFAEILDENIQDAELKKKMMVTLKERTKLMGNMITSPPKDSDYKK